jgi:hypothetical protein
MPASLEYPPYTEDANGYPVLEPFTSGYWGAWVQLTDHRPGTAGAIGQWANTVSVVSVVPPLPGDYNRNRVVDAADYVAWRKSSSNFGGDPGGYNTWRAHFGQPTGANAAMGAASDIAVPEPISLALLTLAVPALLRCQRQPPRKGLPAACLGSA